MSGKNYTLRPHPFATSITSTLACVHCTLSHTSLRFPPGKENNKLMFSLSGVYILLNIEQIILYSKALNKKTYRKSIGSFIYEYLQLILYYN